MPKDYAILVKRWPATPGWWPLLDRARELLEAHEAATGHGHHIEARSKNARIDFNASLYDGVPSCADLHAELETLEDLSTITCQVCGDPGVERPEHPYRTLCARCAAEKRA